MRRISEVSVMRWVFFGVVIICAVSISVLSVVLINQGNTNRELARQGEQAHDALCIFKRDLQQRALDSANFLAKHPDGVAGIDAATIQNSIKNQLATVASLDVLDCVPPPEPK